MPLVFDPQAYVVFAQPKALVSHALAYVLLGILAALALRFGRGLLVRSPLHVAVGGVAAVYVIATLFALDHRVAMFGAADRHLGLATLLDNVLLYVAVVILIRTRADLIWLATAFGTTTLLLLVYEVVQRFGLDPISWKAGYETARPFATLGNPGVLGQYLGTVAAGAGALLVGSWAGVGWRTRSILVVWTVAAAAGSVLTGTRAVALGLLAATTVLGASVVLQRAPARLRPSLGLAVALTVGGLLVLTPIGRGVQDVIGTGVGLTTGQLSPMEGSIAGRLDIYAVAAREVRERPVLGVGPDNFVVAYPAHRSEGMTRFHESDAPQTSPHSWILKVATDAGLMGLGAFMAMIALSATVAMKSGSPPLGLVGLAMVASFLGTGSISINDVGTEWLIWLALGIVAVGHIDAEPQSGPERARRRGRRHGGYGLRRGSWTARAAVALGLLLSLTPAAGLAASHAAADARQSRAQQGEARLQAAVQAARRAVSLDPGRPEYWHELGLAAGALGDGQEALRAFRRAAGLAPYQAVYLTNLAKAQILVGREGDANAQREALVTARAAVATDPYVAEVHYTLALALLSSGLAAEAAKASEAAEHADRAAQLLPGSLQYLQLAVTTHQRAGDLSRAIERQRQVAALTGNSLASRVRLAQLYVAAGESASARALVAPPRVSGADRMCTPVNSVALSSDRKTSQPLCFRVLFASEDLLQADPARTDSVRRPDNFAIHGQALPPTTSITYEPDRAVVVIQLPAGGIPPGANATLTVRRVANSLGFAIEPDPTTIAIP